MTQHTARAVDQNDRSMTAEEAARLAIDVIEVTTPTQSHDVHTAYVAGLSIAYDTRSGKLTIENDVEMLFVATVKHDATIGVFSWRQGGVAWRRSLYRALNA